MRSPVTMMVQFIWRHVLVVMARVNCCVARPVPWFITWSVLTHLSDAYPGGVGHVRCVVVRTRISLVDEGSRKVSLKVSLLSNDNTICRIFRGGGGA